VRAGEAAAFSPKPGGQAQSPARQPPTPQPAQPQSRAALRACGGAWGALQAYGGARQTAGVQQTSGTMCAAVQSSGLSAMSLPPTLTTK
jgi:hypothetical protein